jgi:hypothetical protein
VDYVACADSWLTAIRAWHPDANITVISDKRNVDHGDLGGYANDWQVFVQVLIGKQLN